MNGTGDGTSKPQAIRRPSTWSLLAALAAGLVTLLNQGVHLFPHSIDAYLPLIVMALGVLGAWLKGFEGEQVAVATANVTADHLDPKVTTTTDAKTAETLREVAGTGSGQ